ncbi:hypothetical protein QE152_g15860 [Popillia japonica]|uniref:Uncharacterized protein n=1 Tax=Popillia japonica TaxID=7064 RepID=A0AAW1L6R2_POPJA
MNKVKDLLTLPINKITYWTDSTIVLSWIRCSSKTWKTFVANRISEIHELTNASDWNHVGTAENPADILSRGSTAQVLAENQFWWKGPTWLQEDNGKPSYNEEIKNVDEVPERRQVVSLASEINYDLFNRYSSLTRLQRITAYCLRFKNNVLARLSHSNEFHSGPLKPVELRTSMNILLKIAQQQTFKAELQLLQTSKSLCKSSKILRLLKIAQQQTFKAELQLLQTSKSLCKSSKILSSNPFVDNEGLLRYGDLFL